MARRDRDVRVPLGEPEHAELEQRAFALNLTLAAYGRLVMTGHIPAGEPIPLQRDGRSARRKNGEPPETG